MGAGPEIGHGVNELWLSCNLRPFSTPSAFFDVQ
jgi:hypothetical protein